MRWRFQVILLLYFSCFFAVILRLAHWQIVRADALAALGETQYGRAIYLTPKRGEIRSADGFPLASNKVAYLVFANPKQVEKAEVIAKTLSPLLRTDEASISALLSLNRYWVPLKHEVSFEVKNEVEKLLLPGVGFEEQYVRYYPEASVAAHVVGFLGKNDEGKNQGYFGIEGYYDRQLRGREIKVEQIHDALGRPILSRIENKRLEGEDGRSLTLTIDRAVQFFVHEELKKGVERYGAEGGQVIVMDPKTGAILALASEPTFDPRTYWEFNETLYKNPLISSTFEPGSTFKPIVMASALDEGVVTPTTRCSICNGPIPIGGYEIKTWNGKYYPNQSMIEVIQHSDNTGMVFVVQKLGLTRLIKKLQEFGIGDVTGVDLQGEVSRKLKDEELWYPIDLATAGFGQGISMTPIQLLSAFSAIANEGVRLRPHVVASITTERGKVIRIEKEELSRPITAKTAKIVTEILVNAVDQGEAKWAKPKGYRIAGKTGTAQIPVGGNYDPNKTIASFIGFAPADDPKFVMLVIIDRPTTSIFGSETAAPVFFNIAKKLLLYFGIPPTQ